MPPTDDLTRIPICIAAIPIKPKKPMSILLTNHPITMIRFAGIRSGYRFNRHTLTNRLVARELLQLIVRPVVTVLPCVGLGFLPLFGCLIEFSLAILPARKLLLSRATQWNQADYAL